MKVPFLDLSAQLSQIEPDLRKAIDEVLVSTRYVGGPYVEALEVAIAEYCDVDFAVGVSSGTDALIASMLALGIGHGDRVLTTPFSFFATAGAISRVGGTPIFLDIDPESFNLCPDAVSGWLRANSAQAHSVKAILPVHLYGQCADMAALLEIADFHGLALIEDAAQAIGAGCALAKGPARAGSMGAVGCFSFFPTKNLGGMGEAGAVVTRDRALAERMRALRNHGSDGNHLHETVGGNFRLDAIQAAVLLAKLPYLDGWIAARRENAARYDEAFAGSGVAPPRLAPGTTLHTYNQYVVRVPEHRDELRTHLAARSIETQVYYPRALHLQPCFAELGLAKGDLPHSEAAARECLALPIYPELTREMQAAVVEGVLSFYRG